MKFAAFVFALCLARPMQRPPVDLNYGWLNPAANTAAQTAGHIPQAAAQAVIHQPAVATQLHPGEGAALVEMGLTPQVIRQMSRHEVESFLHARELSLQGQGPIPHQPVAPAAHDLDVPLQSRKVPNTAGASTSGSSVQPAAIPAPQAAGASSSSAQVPQNGATGWLLPADIAGARPLPPQVAAALHGTAPSIQGAVASSHGAAASASTSQSGSQPGRIAALWEKTKSTLSRDKPKPPPAAAQRAPQQAPVAVGVPAISDGREILMIEGKTADEMKYLASLGYTPHQIAAITPEEMQAIIEASIRARAAQQVVAAGTAPSTSGAAANPIAASSGNQAQRAQTVAAPQRPVAAPASVVAAPSAGASSSGNIPASQLFNLNDQEIARLRVLGVPEDSIPSTSRQTFAELTGTFTDEEKNIMRTKLGLDEDTIRTITRQQFIELRGDNLLTQKDRDLLHLMGKSDEQIARMTKPEMDNLIERLKASLTN